MDSAICFCQEGGGLFQGIFVHLAGHKSPKTNVMALELSGKVLHLLAEQTGTGKNGQWSRQDLVIETEEQYPRKVCLSAWGDKVLMIKNMKPGTPVRISFHAESREFNGRWYTDLKLWKVEIQEPSAGTIGQAGYDAAGLEPILPGETGEADGNDLPF